MTGSGELCAGKTAYPALPPNALRWIYAMSVLGLAAVVWSLANWDSPDLLKYGGFFAVALCAAGMRIAAPGHGGTLSLVFLFTLLGIVDFTTPETVMLAVVMTVVHGFWERPVRPRMAQAVLNASSIAVAAAATAWVYHSTRMLATHLDPAVRLAIATGALFVLDTAPLALAAALAEERGFFRLWKQRSFWALPYYLGGAGLAQAASFANQFVGWQTVLLTGPVIYLIYRSYRLYVDRLEYEKKHVEEMSALHLRTIEALALAIEAKDNTTHDHIQRVQVYAMELARELSLTAEETDALRAAALLHDIGKLAVPEHIISKPGRLTPEEFEKMKIHPVVGAEILERVRFPYPVAPVVRAHHEKWDGTGYPAGLSGEEIPVGSRIISAVDCLDALASDRQYRRALPLDQAMKVVISESGKAFDPRIVDLLSQHYVTWERLAQEKSRNVDKLSTHVKFERGAAPAAGFETSAQPRNEAKGKAEAEADFLSSIAAARQEVQALFEISQDLGNSLSLDETLSVLAVRLRRIIPHHSLAIWVLRDEMLVPEYVTGEEYRVLASLQIPLGKGLSGWVAENRKPILNGNPAVEPGYVSGGSSAGLNSAIAVPLEGINGVLGVLTVYHADRDAFTKDHLRVLLGISPKIGISIENALRFRQVESSATTDFLTNLPNARSLFLQLDAEVSRAARSGQGLAVLVADLDGFKQINDRFGHLEGNRVLRAVAAGLKSVCREYDYVARMGGDEFVVLLAEAKPLDAERKTVQLQEVVDQVCRDLFSERALTVSTGIAHFPMDGKDAEELLAEADRRMYQRKRARKEGTAEEPPPSWAANWPMTTIQ